MSMGTSFLGGAKDRLLPSSIPFRFFLSAALFHIAAWCELLLGAGELPGWTGGPGQVLAALHLTTLGVFATTAMGASYQLLPVVTRAALARTWPAIGSFWLSVPGIILLTIGMDSGQVTFMQIGGVLTSAGLSLFIGLTAMNLARAGSVPVVAGFGWAALGALILLAGLGLTLVWDFSGGFLSNHEGLARLHMAWAIFGFMGLLIGGFSMVLIPMFVLSRSLPASPGWVGLGLSLGGLAAASVGLWWLALALGLAASAIHLWLLHSAEKNSMRRRLGMSFILLRLGRYALPMALSIVALNWAGFVIPNSTTLIGFLLIAGWLLTFLMGILQRILPFIASMHASGAFGLPLLISDLTAETPLRVHMFSHFASVALVAVGIVLGDVMVIRLGATVGLVGAVAFAIFAGNVAITLRTAKHASRNIKRGNRVKRRTP